MAKITKRTIEAREKAGQALELRKAGLTYERIAGALGFSDRAAAWNSVNRALAATIQEPAEELRRLESERLDALLRAMWAQAMEGKGWAVDRCLGVMDRRARLLGLDAPARSQVTVVTEDVIDTEIRRLEEELAANAPDGDHRSTAGEAAPIS